MATVLAEAKPPTSAEIRAGKRAFAAALATKSEVQIKCRALRHAWDQKNAARLINPQTRRDLPIIVIDLRCRRGCNVTAQDTLVVRPLEDNLFTIIERLPRRYYRPDDYPIPGIPRGASTNDILWQDFIRRQAENIAHVDPGERGTSD